MQVWYTDDSFIKKNRLDKEGLLVLRFSALYEEFFFFIIVVYCAVHKKVRMVTLWWGEV